MKSAADGHHIAPGVGGGDGPGAGPGVGAGPGPPQQVCQHTLPSSTPQLAPPCVQEQSHCGPGPGVGTGTGTGVGGGDGPGAGPGVGAGPGPPQARGVGPCTMEPLIRKLLIEKCEASKSPSVPQSSTGTQPFHSGE